MGFVIDFFHFLVVGWPDNLSAFMTEGGDVLWLIGMLTLAMWGLSLERILYYRNGLPAEQQQVLDLWYQRSDRSSWYAQQIQTAMIADVHSRLNRNRHIITSMIALCPLLGLLGTVTGMIEVFHVMAVTGGGDVKLMAGGVSRATIPTMAGMVAALSGIFINILVSRNMTRHQDNFMTQIRAN